MSDPLPESSPKVVIVAGEPSGDLHGAGVVRALKQQRPDITISGAGGNAMAAAGVDLVVHADTLAMMGFTALFAKLPTLFKAMGQLKKLLADLRPALLILVDFPDFNLHLAATANKLGIPVLYYISPTIWAWRAKRIHKIKDRVSHMAVILPFEKQIYEGHRIPVTFVGHPLLDQIPSLSRTPPRSLNDGPLTLALLPGSRYGEVTRLLPVMLAALKRLRRTRDPIRIIISRAPSINRPLIDALVNEADLVPIEITDGPVETIFNQCHAAVITSGTASLEAALAGVPMVIVYTTSAPNYWLGRMLVNVPHIGLANLIAGKRIVPELVQREVTADSIARHITQIVSDPDNYKKIQADLLDVRRLMGKAGVARRVARIADRLMSRVPDNGDSLS